ncbi:hypothetical protein [Saccharopolyspora mangrovi]|uniref:ABC transporter ATP-binding protein n=1 Tax=Saccharopolyspora mangrovi TaxID=3082379 RepID=A0ABU6A800_9PSEU|nr:hypothetical protein [Saccharopolyspora sp. S2-29]MEB3367687.1 hypothetical protein [Saccharopolyspora sp. S2-29]
MTGVAGLAHRVVVLDDGRVVERGLTADVLTAAARDHPSLLTADLAGRETWPTAN